MSRDLNDVVIFLKVVEARSFTAAARLLELPNSTVSRRISRLEHALGVRLLHRTTRKLSLTEAGELYYERSGRALAELEDTESVLAQARATPRGRVKVLVPVEHTVSMRLIPGFLQRYPDVRVDMEFTSRDLNIIQEGYDAAIHIGPITNMSVVAHKLMDSPFRVVASPAYVDRRGEPTTISALSEHDCLVFGASSSNAAWTLVGPNNESVRVPVRGRLAVNHMQAVRDAAVSGLGIALLPLVVCQRDLDSGVLRVVLDGVAPPPVPVYITYPSGRFLAPAVRAYVDYIRAEFRAVAQGRDAKPARTGRSATRKRRKKSSNRNAS